MSSYTVKLKVVKPINMDWQTFGKIMSDMDYIAWRLKNKAINEYHRYITDELEYNRRNPDDKFNAEKRKRKYGYKTYTSLIAKRIRPEYEQSGIYLDILNAIIKEGADEYKKRMKDIMKGIATIPTAKRNQPILIQGRSIKVESRDQIAIPLLTPQKKKALNLKGAVQLKVASKKGHAKIAIERVLNGRYKVCDSHIQKKGKDVYILLVYKDLNPQTQDVDRTKILGIDLGIEKAVTMAVADSWKYDYINGGEIEHFRKRTNCERKSKQNQLKYASENRYGRGRKHLLKPLKNLESKIANFRETTNHRYSKYVVDYAVENACGIIQMEDLKYISKDNTFLADWTYYDLQQKIEYKAEKAGIEVDYVKPNYTSQRCYKCGYISKDNRQNQADFHCQNCGHRTNADINASRNLSIKNIETIIEEQLQSQQNYQEKIGGNEETMQKSWQL